MPAPDLLWFYQQRAKEVDDFAGELHGLTKEDLVGLIVNAELNEFCHDHSGGGLLARKNDPMRIPYQGWYWRSTDFYGKRIPIAKSEVDAFTAVSFVGVCENNKWGYAQRDMTEEEAVKFTEFIWKAMKVGGQPAEQEQRRNRILKKCYDWMQTLEVS